jgi:hypothetical protein
MNDIPHRSSESDDPVASHGNAITYTAAALFAAVIVALIAFAPSNTGTSNQMAVNSPSDSGATAMPPRTPPKAPAQ